MKTKIITQIALQTAANKPLKRAFAFYFKLKSLNTDGFFSSSTYPAAAKRLKITLPTFYSHMRLLRQFGLSVNTKKQFTLISYEKAALLFNTTLKFHYTTHDDVQLVLDALAIRIKKKSMEAAFFRKLKKYPAIEETLKQITGLEIYDSKFREAVIVSLIQDHIQNAQPANKDLYQLNPDDNMGYEQLSLLFGYSGRGSMAYKKRKLIACEMAKVVKRQYRINPHRYSSIMGNVCYYRPVKARVLTLCDNMIFS